MNIGNTVYFKQINIPIVAASANGKAFSLALDIAGNEVDQRRDVSFERRIYQLSPRSLAKCTADGRDDLGRALRKTERKKEERLKSRRNKKKKKKKLCHWRKFKWNSPEFFLSLLLFAFLGFVTTWSGWEWLRKGTSTSSQYE